MINLATYINVSRFLKVLDLSSTRLDQNLNPEAFTSLPSSIRHLDISSEYS
jgi:hypothetical protein